MRNAVLQCICTITQYSKACATMTSKLWKSLTQTLSKFEDAITAAVLRKLQPGMFVRCVILFSFNCNSQLQNNFINITSRLPV